ncbi:MAG: hypothetical protein IVW36_00135 [Dehalococcoidia bacterium]|nr:hypothetical protein [Dehalococcoidia bacterium]
MPDDPMPPAGEGDDAPDERSSMPQHYESSAPADDDRRWSVPPWLFVAAVIVPAVIVGVVVWFIAAGVNGGSSGTGGRSQQDVASILNAFSSQQGATSTRFEGKLPPGFPSGIPTYPGATLVSSLRQVQNTDASYLIVYDTADQPDKVAKFFDEKLNSGPWQLQGGQTDSNGTVHQFSNTRNPNITGLALIAESKDKKVTTILESIQVVAGATGTQEAYSPGASKALPSGFPSSIPQYPGSVTIQSGYQKQAQGNQYIISLVTKDAASKVLDFYRNKFTGNGWTVSDAPDPNATPADSATPGAASPTPSGPATAISFNDAKKQLSGSVSTSKLTQDQSYTRVDVQVALPAAGTPSGG